MITKEQKTRIDILFKQIGNLESSDSSTMTDLTVCGDLISQKFDINLSYMDICCGKGTILLCLYIEYWNKLDISDIEKKNKYIIDRICGVDISKAQADIAKNTLKKIQKILKIKNILEPFIYNYNILSDKKKVNNLKRKFSCVITNPPYNSERGDNNQSVDIYPDFVDKAFELADRYVIMITKSNWMNKPSMKDFREKMINKYNVDRIVHYPENPFRGTRISGGVSYFVIDNQNTKETFELNRVVYDRKVALDFLPYELNKDELFVLNKLFNVDKIDMNNFRAQGYYTIKTNDSRLLNDNNDNVVECHVSEQKGKIKFFPKLLFNDKIKNDLLKPKIFTTSAYGTNPFALGRILKSDTNQICSESLVSWTFNSIEERDTFYDYMNTKLFRVAVSFIKNKKHVSKNTFSLIPNIDFSKLEKVDDNNIYKYLNLTEEDIQTIEERCERLKLLR
jgi:site-specific DNA-methyltransferase (adenine-specific)